MHHTFFIIDIVTRKEGERRYQRELEMQRKLQRLEQLKIKIKRDDDKDSSSKS